MSSTFYKDFNKKGELFRAASSYGTIQSTREVRDLRERKSDIG
jgi:hypothetical protein